MKKIAVYGKGGIGKSTTVSNLAVALAEKGYKVMQIGCDPKADSTIQLRHGKEIPTVLEMFQQKKQNLKLEDMVTVGYAGVVCVEAGGPTPGLGCAGRGIITALEKLEETGAYETYQPDIVLYDVLGDVVCGGFSMPMRKAMRIRYSSSHPVKIWRSMPYQYCNGSREFQEPGICFLGGIILNKREVPREEEKVRELAEDFHTQIIGRLDRSELVMEAEEAGKILLEYAPDSQMAEEYRKLADQILAVCGEERPC